MSETLNQIHETSSFLLGRPNYVRSALSVACRMSDLWDLERPADDFVQHYPMDCARYFWWRRHASGECQSHIERVPFGVSEKDWRVEDRKACMSAICGILNEKAYQALEIRCILNISGGTHHKMCRLWREETVDYRKMVTALHGDLGSKALRELVLGISGASYGNRECEVEHGGDGRAVHHAGPGAGR